MELDKQELIKVLGHYLKSLREQKGTSLNIFAYENDLTTPLSAGLKTDLLTQNFRRS